jgi:integration host factor subunit beta
MGMIKSDLVRRVLQQNPHLQLRDVEKIVNAIFNEIADSLTRGERIALRGFGAFSVKVREARTGRNPKTGVPFAVPKRAAPQFKAGKETRERLNKPKE